MAQNKNTAELAHAAEITQGSSHNANVTESAQESPIFQGVVHVENNAASITELIPLQRVLHTILGINQTQCIDVAYDGYEDFMEFENMQ